MDQTHKLIMTVAQNACTGLEACDQLMARTEDEGIRRELLAERRQYQEFVREAEDCMSRIGGKFNRPGLMQRAGMWMGVQMNTALDKSPQHIADIAIQGATMGVVSMTRERRELPDADEDVQSLASRFITAQQENIDRLKEFL
ncbi:MAG: hypothetical protein U0L09_01390 [Christensenellales bacterium]|nr:hypothetical protein [Christensenellales bacterium]